MRRLGLEPGGRPATTGSLSVTGPLRAARDNFGPPGTACSLRWRRVLAGGFASEREADSRCATNLGELRSSVMRVRIFDIRRRIRCRLLVLAVACIVAGVSLVLAATSSAVPPGPTIYAVACASVDLCVVGDQVQLVSWTNPSGGGPTWVASNPGSLVDITAISCPSTTFCAAADSNGLLSVSSDPAADTPAWSAPVRVLHVYAFVHAISCISTSLCALVGGDSVAISTDPTATSPVWNQQSIDAGVPAGVVASPSRPALVQLTGISCPSLSLCVAVDNYGRTFVSTDPTAPSPKWSVPVSIDSEGLSDVSCPSTSLCIAFDFGGNALGTSDPTSAAPAWTLTATPDHRPVYLAPKVSCGSPTLCVSFDGSSNALISTNPGAPSPTWRTFATGNPGFGGFGTGVSCVSTTMCVLVYGGAASVSTDPTAVSPTWRQVAVDGVPHTTVLRIPPRIAGKRATFVVSCSTSEANVVPGDCPVVATLRTIEIIGSRRHSIIGLARPPAANRRDHTIIVGRVSVRVTDNGLGSPSRVTLALNGTGKQLLARFARLPATLQILVAAPGPPREPPRLVPLDTASVTFGTGRR